MIDKRSSVPLYMQIQNLLLEQIRAGEYEPGAQVPSEWEIAERHNVSRMTARKALDTLVSKGVLFRSKGKGTYVAEGVVSYGLSTMLSFSRTLQARGYEVITKVLVHDVVPGSAEVTETLQLSADSDVVVIRRLRLIEDKPAAIHTSFLEHRLFAAVMQVDLNTESLLDTIQQVSGISIAYTTDSVQADLATTEEADLLESEVGRPVLRIEGIAYSEIGQPMRLTRAVYRGDMFKMNVKNTAEYVAALNISDTTLSN